MGILYPIISQAQERKSIAWIEKCIENDSVPESIQTDKHGTASIYYWAISEDYYYRYNKEHMLEQGYIFASRSGKIITYVKCEKSIVVTMTRWVREGILEIWVIYDPQKRSSYLYFCN